jgi:hypothetical protein
MSVYCQLLLRQLELLLAKVHQMPMPDTGRGATGVVPAGVLLGLVDNASSEDPFPVRPAVPELHALDHVDESSFAHESSIALGLRHRCKISRIACTDENFLLLKLIKRSTGNTGPHV